MELIAIANIINNENTLGFRLLDTGNGEIKDVPLSNIKSVLKSGTIKIENLGIRDDKVIGTNGSIDRLPTIVGNKLVGKSPLIILSQIEDIGYRVSDYRGSIMNVANKQVVQYAKEHGIANGKVVLKEDKEFISSITGGYRVDKLEDIKNKPSNKKYTGELLVGEEVLKPILCCGAYSFSQLVNYHLVYCANSRTITEKNYKPKNIPTRMDITKGLVHEGKGYTVFGPLQRKLHLKYLTERSEIARLLSLKNFRDSIDNSIAGVYKPYGCKVDNETGLAIPDLSQGIRYQTVVAEEYMESAQNKYSEIHKHEINNYLKKLAVMKTTIIHKISYHNGKLALTRECTDKGINYITLRIEDEGWSKTETVYLEDIFYKHRDYENVTVEGNILTIKGLDGNYKYDMDIINSTYNRFILKNTKEAKAKILGKVYKEAVNASGELKEYTHQGKILEIPPSVRVIHDNSIILRENEQLIFGENIAECGKRCFKNTYKDMKSSVIEYVEIGCGGSAASNIVSSLNFVSSALKTGVIINFKKPVTPDNFIAITDEISRVGQIQYNGSTDYINDKFIIEVVDKLINNKMCKLRVLKKPITLNVAYYNGDMRVMESQAFRKLMMNYGKSTSLWDKIKNKASDTLRVRIDNTFNEIGNQIRDREREAQQSKDRMYQEYTNKTHR